MRVEYSSNNSGGHWWLSDRNWHDLEAAGWDVEWFKDQNDGIFKSDADGRWLGALASHAMKGFRDLGAAIGDWERVTGCASNDLGCSCCGPPHSFSAVDDKGVWTRWSPDYPEQGEAYT